MSYTRTALMLETHYNNPKVLILQIVGNEHCGNRGRQSTVEPVLGTLINFMGIRRIWTRGIKGANKFMLGAAIAYNLKKWLNYKGEKVKAVVVALTKTGKGVCDYFLCIQLSVSGSNR